MFRWLPNPSGSKEVVGKPTPEQLAAELNRPHISIFEAMDARREGFGDEVFEPMPNHAGFFCTERLMNCSRRAQKKSEPTK